MRFSQDQADVERDFGPYGDELCREVAARKLDVVVFVLDVHVETTVRPPLKTDADFRAIATEELTLAVFE